MTVYIKTCQPDSPDKISKESNDLDDALLEFKKVKLVDDEIYFSAEVKYNGNNKNFNGSGKIFNGYKGEHSFVSDLKDENEYFSVELFEIYTDYSPDNTIINSELESKPHLKLYMTDKEDNILIFESEIPIELKDISNKNVSKEEKKINDGLWFINVIEPHFIGDRPITDEELQAIEKEKMSLLENEYSPSGVGYDSVWSHSRVYRSTFYVGSPGVEILKTQS